MIDQEIKEVEELMAKGVGPTAMSAKLVRLSSLLSLLNAKITEADIAYRKQRNDILDRCNSVAQAKVKVEATPEWGELMRLLNKKEALFELIRSIKYYIKSATLEYGEGTPKSHD